MRISYYEFPKDIDEEVLHEHGCSIDERVIHCNVSSAKKLIKQYGGIGWIEHCERDGSLFEVTDIEVNGNNSRFQYNHHL